jgi:hypothetical protein
VVGWQGDRGAGGGGGADGLDRGGLVDGVGAAEGGWVPVAIARDAVSNSMR